VKKRALITGGAGFVGSHVADAFVGAEWDVTVADNLTTGRRENVPDGATFVDIDVTIATCAIIVIKNEPTTLTISVAHGNPVKPSTAVPRPTR